MIYRQEVFLIVEQLEISTKLMRLVKGDVDGHHMSGSRPYNQCIQIRKRSKARTCLDILFSTFALVKIMKHTQEVVRN